MVGEYQCDSFMVFEDMVYEQLPFVCNQILNVVDSPFSGF